ncbi:MAG: RNA 2',3'-cyclic phosphodiesterase [Pseudomonadota bacterium]|uniref:RNA 2',3'-cyclic phosphodiesterase n=1 Tax=Sphingomonas sp. ERG5 TaxID=1381597 RepID=UPI00054AFF36|nr:RNA 2',3'-cyclic phosphodiesterase [Sphingomonas sp. ERG5]
MHRLFVALRPPLPIRDAMADLMDGVPEARWQDDEQLHLTLRYIGEVDRRTAEDVADALSRIHAPAIDVRLTGVGQFDRKGRTHTLWAGVTPAEPLAALHQKVDHALIRFGLAAEERAYLPHVTLARLPVAAGAAPEIGHWLEEHSALASEPFRLEHLMLFESHLGPGGARYEAIARWPLF